MARRAEKVIERVALALFICPGIAAYFASRVVELPFARAGERFMRALEVKESDGRALAGRAIAALERGENGQEVEGWLEEAMRVEPLVPIVILAGARRRQATGDLDGARREGARALERLRELGMQGWVPYFEKLLRRWRIGAPEAPENTRQLS